jgi:hypothetical protein
MEIPINQSAPIKKQRKKKEEVKAVEEVVKSNEEEEVKPNEEEVKLNEETSMEQLIYDQLMTRNNEIDELRKEIRNLKPIEEVIKPKEIKPKRKVNEKQLAALEKGRLALNNKKREKSKIKKEAVQEIEKTYSLKSKKIDKELSKEKEDKEIIKKESNKESEFKLNFI